MTQELELIFDTKITEISKACSSIFSREDVVIILKTLRQSIDELPVTTPTIGYDIDTIVKVAEEILDNFPFDECIEIEPELNGSYNGNYSLEFNTSFDDRTFIRNFSQDLSELLQQDKE